MREIKFRYFNRSNKTMNILEDSIRFDGNGDWSIISAIDLGYPDGGVIEYITNSNESILMQYTGLKDKNGKDIYEGDFIVLTKSDRVTYYGQGFIKFKEGAFFINDMLLNDIIYESLVCIVTGNIHEN